MAALLILISFLILKLTPKPTEEAYEPRFKVSLFPVYFVLFIDNFSFAVIFSTFGPLFIDPPMEWSQPVWGK